MYLTQIKVNHNDLAQKGLYDCYRWHQELFKAFGENRFLYRIYEDSDGIRVLVQSIDLPKIQIWGTWDSKKIPTCKEGNFLFSLRANPVVKRAGKRYGKSIEELQDWINGKATLCGFALSRVEITPRGMQCCRKKGQLLKHAIVEFDGALNITDPKAFQESVKAGIGSGKAFGFGLLLLKSI